MSNVHSYEAVNEDPQVFVGWADTIPEALQALSDALVEGGYFDWPLLAIAYDSLDGHSFTAVVSA